MLNPDVDVVEHPALVVARFQKLPRDVREVVRLLWNRIVNVEIHTIRGSGEIAAVLLYCQASFHAEKHRKPYQYLLQWDANEGFPDYTVRLLVEGLLYERGEYTPVEIEEGDGRRGCVKELLDEGG